MAKFVVSGNSKLKGTIKIGGAKNAALKILPASLLGDSVSVISNIPNIADINKMVEILRSIGAEITTNEQGDICVDPTGVNSFEPSGSLVKKLRGSVVLIGPLLAKYGKAVFSQPGGCLIGARSIDDHLDIFRQLGVKVTKKEDKIELKGRPKAGTVTLSKLSVTATENAIMSLVTARGSSKILVAAAEPEVKDLADFLNKMGARIKGAGTHEIEIEGVSKLSGAKHKVLPDRIEAGTYLIAAIATNSKVLIGPIIEDHISLVLKRLLEVGANFKIRQINGESYIETKRHGKLNAASVDTRTYPGFPTDLQSPYAVLMTQAEGKSTIFETLFEGRFLYTDELKMMGAKIDVLSPHIVQITGPAKLKSASISSRDIRGGAALVIAGLLAAGETTITDVEYIDRGYEKMDEKLAKAGVFIKRVE